MKENNKKKDASILIKEIEEYQLNYDAAFQNDVEFKFVMVIWKKLKSLRQELKAKEEEIS